MLDMQIFTWDNEGRLILIDSALKILRLND